MHLGQAKRGTQLPQQGSLFGSQTDCLPESGLRLDFFTGCMTQQPLALQAVQFRVKPTLTGERRRVDRRVKIASSVGRSISGVACKREQAKIVGRIQHQR